ncbi:hypothetical protein Mapa_010164 [Marchantia paleacea]|nr:hypothetical protein Mapa_010164 [Marchantia paleacea]
MLLERSSLVLRANHGRSPAHTAVNRSVEDSACSAPDSNRSVLSHGTNKEDGCSQVLLQFDHTVDSVCYNLLKGASYVISDLSLASSDCTSSCLLVSSCTLERASLLLKALRQ